MTRLSVPAKTVIGLIRIYRRLLSPLLGRRCRFHPTCSAYAIEAIRKKGLAAGLVRSCWRVLRCNPFGRGGYDPVAPEAEVEGEAGRAGASGEPEKTFGR